MEEGGEEMEKLSLSLFGSFNNYQEGRGENRATDINLLLRLRGVIRSSLDIPES